MKYETRFAGEAFHAQAILTAYRGSIAHGMYVPNTDPDSIDDKDVMVVTVPGEEYYLGLDGFQNKGTKEVKADEWDVVVYEMRKFVWLLLKSNPNVLGMLWLEPQHYIRVTEAGQGLIENRELFSSLQAYHAFVGYARGQLHRMTHGSFQGYMGEKRRALVEKHGYDTKNAAHLVRLLRMGIEFLKEGHLYVQRPDAGELLEIKHGEWTLERVKAEADRLFALAEDAYVHSHLPAEPDREQVGQVCQEMGYSALYARGRREL